MMHTRFKFSVVIPVYNVELYIADTIECLKRQTIGFETNCEIILVDDGSSDNTAKVCKEYVAEYPENIFYIKQKNAGPGAARNHGVKKAKGKYISLLDSDDILSPNTLEEVYEFFESHYNEIDVIGIKMKFFEAKTGNHPLNYKFDAGNRVIDLGNEYEAILGSAATGFFKREVFDTHTFDHSVGRYSEDLRFMGEVLMDKMKYGVVSAPTYFYRKRYEQTSSQDGNKTDKFWYLGTPKYALLDMLQYAKKHNDGVIPKFIQYNVMYEMKWRFKQSKQTALGPSELEQYKSQLYNLLKYIDDDVIMKQRGISITLKLFVLKKKHNTCIDELLERRTNGYFIGENIVFDPRWEREVCVDLIEHQNGELVLHGFTSKPVFSHEKIICKSGGKEYTIKHTDRPHKKVTFLGDTVYDFNCFSVTVPLLDDGQNIKFFIKYGNSKVKAMNIAASRHSGLPYYTRIGSYRNIDNRYLLCHPKPDLLTVLQYTLTRQFMQEMKYEAFLGLSYMLNGVRKIRSHIRRRQHSKHDDTPAGKRPTKQQAASNKVSKSLITKIISATLGSPLMYRFLYYVTKPFMGEVWLVTDRISAADDNGEVFFNYLMTQPNRGRKSYFVIDKHTEDYKRIKKVGKVIDFMSFKHKLLTLHASKIISSEATEFVLNPFFGRGKYLWDLLDYDFVFLQHGIIRDDISSWLNKYNKNIRLFITSAKPEYTSVVEGDYGYSSRELVLTGLARYDNLKNDPKNKLILMPTWRQDIVGKPIEGTDERYYNPNFTKSEFFTFWNTLLQDKRIASALKKAGMTAELYLHHGLRAQAKDFTKVSHVTMMDFPYDYPKAKQEGSLLVTDYSSVGLDFAYLKKPVIYAQFDVDTYYSSSVSTEGYLSYEEKGLGPVVYTYDDTVRQILNYIQSGCVMENKYVKRAADFFGYFDRHNSRRIYQAILNIDDNDSLINSIKKSSGYKKKLRKWNKSTPVLTYWWRYKYPVEQNFGDELTAYILAAIWGLRAIWARPNECTFAGAGSIIELLNDHAKDNTIKVWGSGFITEGSVKANDNLDVYAVRGPKSRARVPSGQGVVLGDPGILSNLVFNASPKKSYKVGIVVHYMDVTNPIITKLSQRADVCIVDPLCTPDKVVMDITSCEYIASSSLHGLIVADSFGIPNNWMPLSRKVKGGQYKFQDHYQATDRKLVKVSPEMLEDNTKIEQLVKQYEPIKDLQHVQQTLIKSMPIEALTQ